MKHYFFQNRPLCARVPESFPLVKSPLKLTNCCGVHSINSNVSLTHKSYPSEDVLFWQTRTSHHKLCIMLRKNVITEIILEFDPMIPIRKTRDWLPCFVCFLFNCLRTIEMSKEEHRFLYMCVCGCRRIWMCMGGCDKY